MRIEVTIACNCHFITTVYLITQCIYVSVKLIIFAITDDINDI